MLMEVSRIIISTNHIVYVLWTLIFASLSFFPPHHQKWFFQHSCSWLQFYSKFRNYKKKKKNRKRCLSVKLSLVCPKSLFKVIILTEKLMSSIKKQISISNTLEIQVDLGKTKRLVIFFFYLIYNIIIVSGVHTVIQYLYKLYSI